MPVVHLFSFDTKRRRYNILSARTPHLDAWNGPRPAAPVSASAAAPASYVVGPGSDAPSFRRRSSGVVTAARSSRPNERPVPVFAGPTPAPVRARWPRAASYAFGPGSSD